jgi:quercetin dioxygenase-like cupin family protein
VIGGSARFTVGDEVVRGTPGSTLWIPRSTRHGIHNDSDRTLEFLWGFDRPRLDEVGIVWDE